METITKTKVLYIVTNSDLGGISKYLLELTMYLPENFEPYYIMNTPGYFSDELKKLGVKDEQIYFVPMTNSIVDFKTHINSNLSVLNIIKGIKPDLIHANATTGAIVGAVCGVLTKIPVIYTVHGWPFTNGIKTWKRIFYKVLEFFICAVYKKIICVSEYDRQIGIKALPMYKNKMITIHNGISDISEENRKNEFSKDELKIVMISRFCPQKDPYTLINAVSGLIKDGYDIKLDLYGYGQELQAVSDLIESKNTDNIRYAGETDNAASLLKNYDVYSLISNWEGLPIGIIEALRAGLPVLVSDVGGNKECVKDNGYLVKRKDVEDCKEKIKKLWDNRNNLSALGQNSRKLFEEEFTAKQMSDKTFEEYKRVC